MKQIVRLLLLIILIIGLIGCGKSNWQEYSGQEYIYYYREGRDRQWEEDLIDLANNYLNTHPYLMDKEILSYYYYFEQGWNNVFDEDKKTDFLAEINALIPKIEKLSDLEILYEIQKIIAVLEDLHSMITDMPYESGFPISVEPLNDQGENKYYVVTVPEEYSDLLFDELISINDIPVSEVIEKIAPYISTQNECWVERFATQWGSYLSIQNLQVLKSCGVVNGDATSASFTFRDEHGFQTIELQSVSNKEHSNVNFVRKTPKYVLDYLNKENHPDNFWYEMIDEDSFYLRIADFNNDSSVTLIQCVSKLAKEITDKENVAIILDLRGNTGGQNLDGEKTLTKLLEDSSINEVYVLIDSSTVSYAVSFASMLNTEFDKVVLAGTPAAEGSEGFGYSYLSYFEMPHHGYTYGVANTWYQHAPDETFDALEPEVLIYQSLSDYLSGKDTILSTVIKMCEEEK